MRKWINAAAAAAVAAFLFIGSGNSAAAEDEISAHFTCRLKDGSIAATTLPAAAEDRAAVKSSIFQQGKSLGPQVFRNVSDGAAERPWSEVSFNSEIIERLKPHLAQIKRGETRRVEIQSAVPAGMPEAERFIRIAGVQTRAKSMQVPADHFRRKTKQEPAVGLRIDAEEGFASEVTAFDGAEVEIKVLPPSGSRVKTPYGVASVRDAGERYELDIDARVGTLLRAGPLVGRISAADKDWITLDFGHPFGGETLICDVTVESISEAPKRAGGIPASPKTESVEPGDGVGVNFRLATDGGELVATNSKEEADNPAVRKHPSFSAPARSAPERLIAGDSSPIPGLSEAIIGMQAGEKKRVLLRPDSAFGGHNPADVKTFPVVKRLPKVMVMAPGEYRKHFQADPALDAEVPLTPYFKGRVAAFEGENPIIAALAAEGSMQESFGTVRISIENGEVSLSVAARIGAEFEMNGRSGRITQAGEHDFTVDFNHPLAGKEMVLDVEVVSLVKAAALKASSLSWVEDHDMALQAGSERNKPVILMLYADWCDWCKKLMNESLQDPRIKLLKDDFVWAKIDSGKEQVFAELYHQKSYPMIVVLSPKGDVIRKIEGYRDAAGLRRELESM